jgi:hypothetical protein
MITESCLRSWINLIDSHVTSVQSTVRWSSILDASWTQEPCKTYTEMVSIITSISRNSSRLSAECDGRMRVPYAWNRFITTTKTLSTDCRDIFFRMKRNSTLTAGGHNTVIRTPQIPWPDCSIPHSECKTAWNLFSQHFEKRKQKLTAGWDFLYPEASATVAQDDRHVNKTATRFSFDIERFLRWCNYVPHTNFLNGCPDAKLPFIRDCFNKPPYYVGAQYDDILRSLSWPHDKTFHSLNSSQKLEEFGKLLACDIWIDRFMLIVPPISKPYMRSRDLCANDGWGDFTDLTVANQTSYTLDNITFTLSPIMYSTFICYTTMIPC